MYSYQLELYRTLITVGKIFSMIPQILIMTGLWMMFAAASNKRTPIMKTSGITMLKVMNIIGLVFSCIGYAVAEIVLLVATIGMSFLAEETLVIMILAMVILIIVAVLNIIYYVKINKTLSAMKIVAMTGKPNAYASRFVGVLAFLNAFVGLISTITTRGVFNRMSALCAAVATGCFGAMIFVYRKRMSMCAVTPPVSYAPPVQPTQPVQETMPQSPEPDETEE